MIFQLPIKSIIKSIFTSYVPKNDLRNRKFHIHDAYKNAYDMITANIKTPFT